MRGVLGTVYLVLLAGSAVASDADSIRAFLAVSVEERFAAALEAGAHRYLAVYGFSLEVPGIPEPESRWSSSQVLPIPGTSDHGDFELNGLAREYAAKYNRLLQDHLTKHVR